MPSDSGIGGDMSGKDEGDELGGGELDMRMLQAKEERLKDEEIAKRIMDRAQAAGKAYQQVRRNHHATSYLHQFLQETCIV
jgi:hypothetical protein